MNLVLVSRTESKLAEQEEELRSKYSIKIKHCAADLCKGDDATFSRLAEALEGVDVGILINNAGMSYDHPDYLETLGDDFLRDLININCLSPTRVSRRAGLREAGRERGPGTWDVGRGRELVGPAAVPGRTRHALLPQSAGGSWSVVAWVQLVMHKNCSTARNTLMLPTIGSWRKGLH
jgi:NAD(P)-dependent dehydrogenase (short-subunit alcohol dehydrogenase family)